MHQQRQCGETIENMAIAALVHHRGNVIETIPLGHQRNEMVIQPTRIQELNIEYRPKEEKY